MTYLNCLNANAAAAVVAEWSNYGAPANTVTQEGDRVRIDYFDCRYALDVAEWAFENGHAYDEEAASGVAAL
jgi:hypothetical protein